MATKKKITPPATGIHPITLNGNYEAKYNLWKKEVEEHEHGTVEITHRQDIRVDKGRTVQILLYYRIVPKHRAEKKT